MRHPTKKLYEQLRPNRKRPTAFDGSPLQLRVLQFIRQRHPTPVRFAELTEEFALAELNSAITHRRVTDSCQRLAELHLVIINPQEGSVTLRQA